MAYSPVLRISIALLFSLVVLLLATPAQAETSAAWTFNQTSYDVGESGELLLNVTNLDDAPATITSVDITFDWQWGEEQTTNISACDCGAPTLLASETLYFTTWCAGKCIPNFTVPIQGISEGVHSYRIRVYFEGGSHDEFYGNDFLVYSTGVVEADSQPGGAYVFVDGMLAGTTPMIVQGLSPGSHEFIFFLPGYLNKTLQVDVVKGNNPPLFAILLPAGPGSPGTATLSVATEPAGALTYLDDSYVGDAPLVLYNLAPGTHTLELVSSGYQNYSQELELVAGNNSVFIAMQPEEGSIHVTSTPSGAGLYIDGIFQGNTPLTVQGLYPGPHIFTLSMDGYANYTRTLVIGTSSSNSLHGVLSQGYGTLYISSNPTGAEVYLDDILYGITPISMELIPTGNYLLSIRMSGYEDHESNITVLAGENAPIFVSLVARTSIIDVQTTPSGATFFLDGLNRGSTPRIIAGVSHGLHEYRISLGGYEDFHGNILVAEGTNVINVTLKPLNGSLHVISDPDGASIFIDGVERGYAPLYVENLSVGTHNLRVELEGYFTSTSTFTVVVGETTLVEVTLNFNFLPYIFYLSICAAVLIVTLVGVRLGWTRVKLLTAGWFGLGTVFIYTNPPGAKVKVDAARVGRTPVTLDRIRQGVRRLELELPGYLKHRQQLEIKPGLNPPLMLQLEPDPKAEKRTPVRTVDVVVDGSNATKVRGDEVIFERIFLLDEELKRLGYNPFWIFDASYRHLLSPKDRRYFERLIEDQPGRFLQSTVGDEADIYILSFAKLYDAMVLSNDRYSDYFPLDSQDDEINLKHLQRNRAKIEHTRRMGITRPWYLQHHITTRFSGDKVVVIDRKRGERKVEEKDDSGPGEKKKGDKKKAHKDDSSNDEGGEQRGKHSG